MNYRRQVREGRTLGYFVERAGEQQLRDALDEVATRSQLGIYEGNDLITPVWNPRETLNVLANLDRNTFGKQRENNNPAIEDMRTAYRVIAVLSALANHRKLVHDGNEPGKPFWQAYRSPNFGRLRLAVRKD